MDLDRLRQPDGRVSTIPPVSDGNVARTAAGCHACSGGGGSVVRATIGGRSIAIRRDSTLLTAIADPAVQPTPGSSISTVTRRLISWTSDTPAKSSLDREIFRQRTEVSRYCQHRWCYPRSYEACRVTTNPHRRIDTLRSNTTLVGPHAGSRCTVGLIGSDRTTAGGRRDLR